MHDARVCWLQVNHQTRRGGGGQRILQEISVVFGKESQKACLLYLAMPTQSITLEYIHERRHD